MLNLKATLAATAVLAGASASGLSDEKVLVTHCLADTIAYKYEKRLFQEAKITQFFSITDDKWTDWCVGQGLRGTIDGKTAICERIIQSDVRLERKQVNRREFTTIIYERDIGDHYYPPGGSEALANIGDKDAQFVRYERKTIDFSKGAIMKKREQFLAPRGIRYTSADTALDDAYYRTVQRHKSTSYHKNGCTL